MDDDSPRKKRSRKKGAERKPRVKKVRLPYQFEQITKHCRLAQWLVEQRHFDQARAWLQRALDIAVTPIPKVVNQEFLEAQILTNFIEVDRIEKKYADAVPRIRRAVGIYERLNLPDPMPTLHLLAQLVEAHGQQRQFDDAELAARRLLQMVEKHFGREDYRYATGLGSLATVYFQRGKGETALKLCTQELQLLERLHGPDHPEVANTLLNMAHLLRWMRRTDEADACERRAQEIESKQPKLVPKPPNTGGPA